MTEQLLIRNLPDGTKSRLLDRARRGGRKRSAESEARLVLHETLDQEETSPVEHYLAVATEFRKEFGGIELPRIEYNNYLPRGILELDENPELATGYLESVSDHS